LSVLEKEFLIFSKRASFYLRIFAYVDLGGRVWNNGIQNLNLSASGGIQNLYFRLCRLFFYPPSQKATGVNPWMNAKRVTLRSLGEGGYASAGFAEVCEDATAVKPWSFTPTPALLTALSL